MAEKIDQTVLVEQDSPTCLEQIIQLRPILLAVLLNILLTLSLWVLVYKMETDTESGTFYLLDSRSRFTTGNDVHDGLLNGVMCISALAILSFVMLGFALYDFQMVVKLWLMLSCVMVNYVTSSLIIRDTVRAITGDESNDVYALLISAVYGTVGCLVFFTGSFPLIMHKIYVICNCSMVSVFYLRVFPQHTAWFVLAGVIVWDLFAVLSPMGPLRKVTEKASDYSEQILRLLTFDAETPGVVENNETEEDSASSSNESYESFDTAKMPSQKDGRTAHDALQDPDMTRLGMGDFVFYGLLVGKAAASGSVYATFNALVGVIAGLIITLTALPDCEETIPALPVSVALGLSFYFGTLYVLEPLYSVVSALA